MSKTAKIITICVLSGLAVAIFVVCMVFALNNKDDNDNQNGNSFSLDFDYGTNLSVKLGDTFSFAPVAADQNSFVTYLASDDSMIEIDSNGNASFKKAGVVTVEVANHNVKIHSTQVSISFDYEITELENCAYHDGALYVFGTNASFVVTVLSSSGTAFVSSNNPTFASSNGLVAEFFFGHIFLSNVMPSILTISYAEQNIAIQIAVVVEQ